MSAEMAADRARRLLDQPQAPDAPGLWFRAVIDAPPDPWWEGVEALHCLPVSATDPRLWYVDGGDDHFVEDDGLWRGPVTSIEDASTLARDLIAEAEANERLYDNARTEIGRLQKAHEVTRAALADALQAITDAPLAALPVDPEADARAEAWIRDNHAPAQSRRMVDPDQHAAVVAERDGVRAELAAAQDRLTWPRWMEAWDGSYGLVPSDGGPYLAIVCPEDGMWRPWSGIGCNDQRSPGSFDEAEAYLVDLGHIRAGCTIRPCARGAR